MKRLTKAALAGTAAIALAATGATYAGWSDYHVDENNTVGADYLELVVNESATRKFDNVKLYPNGAERDLAFYVASRAGDAVPAAGLTMTIKDLVGTEDGCTTGSEDDIDDCENANEGDFASQTLYYVQAKKTADPSTCNTSGMDGRLSNTRLSIAEDLPVNLLAPGDALAAGEGVCVLAHVFMPNNAGQYGFAADNASQGDSATFDVRFDLTQQ